MCKCLKCNRTVSEILNIPKTGYSTRVPVLYLAEGALPVCIRCATEDVIPLSLYGQAIVEYDVVSDTFVCTDNRLNKIMYNLTNSSVKNNYKIYQQVYRDIPKPNRMGLNI